MRIQLNHLDSAIWHISKLLDNPGLPEGAVTGIKIIVKDLKEDWLIGTEEERTEERENDMDVMSIYEQSIAPRNTNNGENLDGYYEWLHEHYQEINELTGDIERDYDKLHEQDVLDTNQQEQGK